MTLFSSCPFNGTAWPIILMYRDGVSEGQFSHVLLHEMDAIRKVSLQHMITCKFLFCLPPLMLSLAFLILMVLNFAVARPAPHWRRGICPQSPLWLSRKGITPGCSLRFMGGVIWLTRVGTYFLVSSSMSLVATICYLLKHCWLWLLFLLSCRKCVWTHDLPPNRLWLLPVQQYQHTGRHLIQMSFFYAFDLQCLHTECLQILAGNKL